MNSLRTISFHPKKIVPISVILVSLLLLLSISFVVSSKDTTIPDPQPVQQEITNTAVDTSIPTISTSPTTNVLGSNVVVSSPTQKPTITKQPTPNATNTPTIQSTSPAPTQTVPTATSIPPSPTLTVAVEIAHITLEIKTPDSSVSFSITHTEGMNVCDILQKAKDDGKINSVTFDDSYLATFNSRYVYEINGYKNNWGFKVNGESPLGCSLSKPKPNDTIEWKFG